MSEVNLETQSVTTQQAKNDSPTKKELSEQEQWTEIIRPETPWWDLKLRELYRYRDLVRIFVWRDFIAAYKQTILGPLWHFINPFASSIINTLVFGTIAQIPMEGLPPFLFQFTSMMLWSYFVRCFNTTQNTFLSNAGIFSKVYFPRLAVPVSGAISALFQFGILFIFYIGLVIFFRYKGVAINFHWLYFALLPVWLLLFAMTALGLGAIVAALTTKYRDLSLFVGYGLSLLMYISAVVFPVSAVPEKFQTYVHFNPIVPLMELGRYALLGVGTVTLAGVVKSLVFAIVIFLIGVAMFNRAERTFIDSV
ncbi:MAG: ABC transporter permease [Bernardetiaceae bacterium]|nr:ABC transporter permease [Bernardetiaceae bacterium]